MITYHTGDILKSNAEALVNTVNCVGVMGKGLAGQMRSKFPKMFLSYRRACDKGEVQPGKMHVYMTGTFAPPRFIINFPTKRHWRDMSLLEDIESGMKDLLTVTKHYGFKSIAIPQLGCGLGGLVWKDAQRIIVMSMCECYRPRVNVMIYGPRREYNKTLF